MELKPQPPEKLSEVPRVQIRFCWDRQQNGAETGVGATDPAESSRGRKLGKRRQEAHPPDASPPRPRTLPLAGKTTIGDFSLLLLVTLVSAFQLLQGRLSQRWVPDMALAPARKTIHHRTPTACPVKATPGGDANRRICICRAASGQRAEAAAESGLSFRTPICSSICLHRSQIESILRNQSPVG